MNVDSNRSAGVESADSRSNADHPVRTWSSAIAHVQAAEEALRECNKQEAAEALAHLREALAVFAFKAGEACEG